MCVLERRWMGERVNDVWCNWQLRLRLKAKALSRWTTPNGVSRRHEGRRGGEGEGEGTGEGKDEDGGEGDGEEEEEEEEGASLRATATAAASRGPEAPAILASTSRESNWQRVGEPAPSNVKLSYRMWVATCTALAHNLYGHSPLFSKYIVTRFLFSPFEWQK